MPNYQRELADALTRIVASINGRVDRELAKRTKDYRRALGQWYGKRGRR